MYNDVQQLDERVYRRRSDAQRCQVKSALLLPVFGSGDRSPLAVFEMVTCDSESDFPALVVGIGRCLEVRFLDAYGTTRGACTR